MSSKPQQSSSRRPPNGKCRQRKAHNKVRTGCLTCKIRRKKCDEAKPVCHRCSSIGIKCDGYASPKSAEYGPLTCYTGQSPATSDSARDFYTTPSSYTSAAEFASYHNSPMAVTTSFAPMAAHQLCYPKAFVTLDDVSDIERQCFSYFRHRTGPEVASYFESSLWWLDTTRCTANSALFSAAVALGAVHRRASYGISREAFEYCEHAARLYSIAKTRLAHLKAQSDHTTSIQESETIIQCEVLLCMFQTFQDEQSLSAEHLQAGLEHFFRGRPMRLTRSERRHCVSPSKPRIFCRLFHRLYCKAIGLFDTYISIPSAQTDILAPMPHKFESIDQARDCIFTEVWWVMSSPARWHNTAFRVQARNEHLQRLATWDMAYTRLSRELVLSQRDQKACSLVKLARNALYLLWFLIIRTDPFEQGCIPIIIPDLKDENDSDDSRNDAKDGMAFFAQTLFDAARNPNMLSNNLAKIKTMIVSMLDDPRIWGSTKNEFDSTENTTMSLFSSPATKSQEDLATKMGIYTVAQNVHATGEGAILNVIQSIIPRDIEMECVDTEFMLEGRKVLLRYYTPNEMGSGVWWMEELWEIC